MTEREVDEDVRREMNTLVAAYVLDALPQQERTAFERYLELAPDTAHEVAELFATSAILGSTSAVAPPPGLRDRVLAAATQIRPLPPLVPSSGVAEVPDVGSGEMLLRRVSDTTGSRPPGQASGAHLRTRADDDSAPHTTSDSTGSTAVIPVDFAQHRRRRGAAFVAAVVGVAALLVLGVIVAVQAVRLDRAHQQVQVAGQRSAEIATIAQRPDVSAHTTSVAGGGRATVLVSAAANRGVVLLDGVSDLPNSKTYELWLIDGNGQPRPVTTFDASDNQATIRFGGVRPGDSLGLSVEPEGGSTTGAPTTPPVFAVKLI